MNRPGQVCLVLTVILTAVWFCLGSMLGNYANSWSVKLRDAQVAGEKSAADRGTAVLELQLAQAELARTKLGWGFEWTFPANGNVGAIQAVGANLAVTGLGTLNGLTARSVEINGREQAVAPTVHVFALNGQGGSAYIGEFIADLQQLGETSCTLTPTWFVRKEDLAQWNFSQGVRLRSQVPAAERASIEGINQQLRRTIELHSEAVANIADQQALLKAAQQQLQTRRGELLGNPNVALIEDQPEHTVGLVKALEDLEESRNAAQLRVDQLRRSILRATEARGALIEEVRGLAERFPVSKSVAAQTR